MTDPTRVMLTDPPPGYVDWLSELKTRIHTAQQRAALAVNRELVLLYWQIGCDILARQAEQGWGAKVIERLALDLRNAFPQMKGFSPRNLKYMKTREERDWYLAKAVEYNWSRNILVMQIETRLPSIEQIERELEGL